MEGDGRASPRLFSPWRDGLKHWQRAGEQLPSIMQAGRWKTAEMVGRYTAKQGARQSAAVRIAERRVQF
jgi:hypothetical protein